MLPVQLNIENFLSHSNSSINFEKFNIALIVGTYNDDPEISNGSGKSAIISSIEWALFGKSRHKRKDGIVKKDKRTCKVEFIFDVDGIQYKITRQRDKIVGENDVIFEQFDGKNYKNISCDTNTATDDKIIEILKFNHEIFLNSVYFKQNDISSFAESTSSKRKDIIKSMLKMDVWDEYQDKAKSSLKIFTAKLEEKKKLLIDSNLDDELDMLKEEISYIQDNLIKLNAEQSKLNEELISKTSAQNLMMANSTAAPEQLKKIQKEYIDAKKRITGINSKLIENYNLISSNEKIILGLQQNISQVNEKIKAKKDINLPDLNSKLVLGKTKAQLIKDKINHLQQDLILGDICPTCDKKVAKDDVKNLKTKRQAALEEEKLKYSDIVNKLNKAQELVKVKTVLVEDGNKAEIDRAKLEVKLLKSKNIISIAKTDNEQLSLEIKKLQERDFEQEIKKIEAAFNKAELDKLDVEIRELNSKIFDIKTSCDNLNIDYGSKVKSKDNLEKTKLEQVKLKDEIKKINEDFVIYDKLIKYFGKDGIQAVIIENVIEDLENYTNDTLTKICNEPTSISIQTQKQNDNGSWTETFDISIDIGGRADEFEALSGGEQFRISLCLRLALSKILSKRMGGNLKFLLLDEVSSSLDDKGIKMFIDVVKQISNDMKVLIITHDEKLKEQFDDIIVVNKTASGSKVM